MVSKRLTISGAKFQQRIRRRRREAKLRRETIRARRLIELVAVPGWRNGRRRGLKIRCPRGRAGSTPAPGTSLCFPRPNPNLRYTSPVGARAICMLEALTWNRKNFGNYVSRTA